MNEGGVVVDDTAKPMIESGPVNGNVKRASTSGGKSIKRK
jgi:hypothetical protein